MGGEWWKVIGGRLAVGGDWWEVGCLEIRLSTFKDLVLFPFSTKFLEALCKVVYTIMSWILLLHSITIAFLK